jgi:hypothetical protein
MKIHLPKLDISKKSWWYAGKRKRQATATAVRFVGDNLLVAHYLGRKLYLLDQSGKVLSEFDTKYETDLLDVKGNLVACTNLFEKKISLFHLTDTLSFYKYLTVPFSHLHGVFIEEGHILCTTDDSLVMVDFDSNCVVVKKFEDQPKDVFTYGPYTIVASTKGLVKAGFVQVPPKATTIHLIKDGITLSQVSIDGQADALTYKVGDTFTIYITLQDIDSVAEITLTDEKLEFKRYITGFNFPHGIHYSNNKIAVSNYGDNSISLLDV